LVEGLTAFRREFSGKYWLEVMLLDGYTTLPPQVRLLAECTRRIRPDKVQLNTAVRPPAEEYAMAVPPERLQELARMFQPCAEVIADYRTHPVTPESHASADAILTLLQRRPCTMQDIAHGLGMKPGEVVKLLADLQAQGQIRSERRGIEQFYRATAPPSTLVAHSCRGKSQ